MGCTMSIEEKAAVARSNEIDKYLAEEALRSSRDFTLLLLGGAESGKNTIIQQMRIIYGVGFTQEDLNTYRPLIYNNTIYSFISILRAMPSLGISFRNNEREFDAKLVFDTAQRFHDTEPFSEELLLAMKKLRDDAGVQECFSKSNQFQINDSAQYFLDYLDRIGMSNYEPTEQDILRTHVSICGFNEITFPIGNLNFTIYDIPNVRCGSRRKWNHIFETATAIMFCVAMSEYYQVLYEDETTNRMQMSLSLFDSICNNKWFTDTPIILFLKKMDLFKEKIKKSPLTLCFPDYKDRSWRRKFSGGLYHDPI
ncbi:guanine nucleotide-binding protein G(o) subunit alpha isoform X2 [Folsomia candida]|uniref:guanine nucleotide-binding protein G(o) subunit alpha isoform X2 n=1 Tax=Folsomia candida TaxID=158441 RepID=UPI000B8EEE4E|nr:guanine nucleotide-binding protein G(o) subunit alpha isoform X2 [Folsomia candida]